MDREFLARVDAALRAVSRRSRVAPALRPAARRFRVNAAFWPGVSEALDLVFMVFSLPHFGAHFLIGRASSDAASCRNENGFCELRWHLVQAPYQRSGKRHRVGI